MRRVLIVDDDPKVCETLDRYFSHAGYATASALDAKKAHEAVRTFAPDLIVLDVMLPEMDGLEIREKPPASQSSCSPRASLSRALEAVLRRSSATAETLLIVKAEMTIDPARSTERDKLAGLANGADDYLTKSFSPRCVPAAPRLRHLLGTDATIPPIADGLSRAGRYGRMISKTNAPQSSQHASRRSSVSS